MKHHLPPARLWKRLFIWALIVLLCYVLLVILIARCMQISDTQPPEDAVWWIPDAFNFVYVALAHTPAVVLLAQLAAFLCPGRLPLNKTDYLISLLLLPVVVALTLFLSCETLCINGSLASAPAAAAVSGAIFAACSLTVPLLSRIRRKWLRRACAVLPCWLWGLSLVVMLGAVIDCFIWVGNDPKILMPWCYIRLPLLSLFGCLPAIPPLLYMESKAPC